MTNLIAVSGMSLGSLMSHIKSEPWSGLPYHAAGASYAYAADHHLGHGHHLAATAGAGASNGGSPAHL